MRGLIRAALLALVVGAASAGTASAQAAPKFGFINSAEILREAPGREAAETRFKTEVTAYEGQLSRMRDSLESMASAFERDAPRLDSAARVTRARTIQATEVSYQNRARELDEQMQRRQGELIRPIMENIQKIIEQVRAEDGYAMIFDVASQASVIVAADKSLDLTPKVLARVKAAPAPTPVAGAPTPQPSGVTAPRR